MNTKRVALLIPHTDITLESDLRRELPSNYIIHTQRIFLNEVGLEAERKMVKDALPSAIGNLKGITEFDSAVFGCTSASAVYGSHGMNRLEALISSNLGCSSKSALGAVLDQLKEIGNNDISLVTPYDREVNEFMISVLKEFGFNTHYSCGIGLRNDVDIAKVKPEEIIEFVKSNHDGITSRNGTVLVSCTNLRATEIREELEFCLDRPVVTSNQSIIKWLLNESNTREGQR